MKKVILILTVAFVLAGASPAFAQGSSNGSISMQKTAILEGAFGQSSRNNCAKIVTEFKRQGAPSGVAYWLGNKIAWRESGCSMQCVSDRDDLSCSRFGINFRFRGAAAAWNRLCGASSRWDTQALRTDVKCALAAYRTMGRRPWS